MFQQNRRAKEKRLKEAEIEKLRINSRPMSIPSTISPMIPGFVGLVKVDTPTLSTCQLNILKHLSLINSNHQSKLDTTMLNQIDHYAPSVSSINLAESLLKSNSSFQLFQQTLKNCCPSNTPTH